MIKKVIVTGGAGFIGHHFVQHLLINTDWNLIILDKLSYAACGLKRLKQINGLNNKRVKIFTIDLSIPLSVGVKKEIGFDVDLIIHMAAETHIDNSISDPVPFVKNNINSTLYLLEFARELKQLKTFFYFSTDEVFGPAKENFSYKENDRHRPTNPYSASKSGAENLCIAYENTYKIPVMIINCMNAFGERQIEKFIPLIINKVLNDELVEIHSYPGCKKSGSRFYIHARNIAEAVLFLLEKGNIGEKYNIVGEKEVSNLDMALFIAKIIGKPLKYKMVDECINRPGHDLRYGLCGEKMEKLGWKLPISFEDSLIKTVKWTLDNKEWLI